MLDGRCSTGDMANAGACISHEGIAERGTGPLLSDSAAMKEAELAYRRTRSSASPPNLEKGRRCSWLLARRRDAARCLFVTASSSRRMPCGSERLVMLWQAGAI